MNFFGNIFYKPQILIWINKVFKHAYEKEWYETYWAFDIHGTISVPDYRRGIKKGEGDSSDIIYYPYAKETLKLLSDTRSDIIKIIYTSSYQDELEIYMSRFKEDGIDFKYVNENPEVGGDKGGFGFYEKKFYFNVLFEDKAGFDAEKDWKPLYDYFSKTQYRPNPNWTKKYKEKYHK